MTLTPQQLAESLDRLRQRLATLTHEIHDLALDTADMEQHANTLLHELQRTLVPKPLEGRTKHHDTTAGRGSTH